MLVTERFAKLTGFAGRVKDDQTSVFVRRHAVTIALVGILLIGGVLRFTGRNWDEGQNLHPDERFLTMVATEIEWPSGITEYFDSQNSPLNPYNRLDGEGNRRFGTFIYGTFPLFLGKAVGDLTGHNVYGSYHLASRGLSATFDLLAVLFVFLVARRLFGDKTGLLAALLASLSVLNIQLSHFGTFDTFVSMLCLATFYFALRAADTHRWTYHALAGMTAGLAIASKLSALPVIFMLGIALVEAIRRDSWRAAIRKPGVGMVPPLLGLALAAICVVWTFRITQPYSFSGSSPFDFRFDARWTDDVDYWSNVQSGNYDMPPSAQWADRPPLLFVLENLVRWGLGPPLGSAALIALGLAGVRLATARRWPPTWQLILVGWPAFHILYHGTAFIKTMRYVLPAYPFLIILAAALLIKLWHRGAATEPAFWRRWGWAPVAGVVLATAFYAVAFTTIYTRPTTRVAASEWIYENLPPGSYAMNEHWDDPIPLNLPGYNAGDYPSEQLELYHNDNEEKLTKLLDQLDRADYLYLTSNRLYGSIPRNPSKYPMATEYYDRLFAGDLGFNLIKTFTSRPQLFGIELNDDNAEEAFTVYDHPKVLIFQKSPSYSREIVAGYLAPKLQGQIVDIKPIQVGYNNLLMTDEERQVQQAGGSWSEIFDRTGISNRHPIRVWYLALQLMALAAFPFCWRVLGGLPDRGYAVAKTLGLLTAGWFAWLLASLHLVDFSRTAVLIGIGATAALSAAVVAPRWRAFGRDLRSRWPEILATEIVFVAAFFAFVWLRSLNPDLWHPWRGGEKPMEFAYFNAVIRSTHFPPYDPWFAGGYINYYYFGYALLASVVRLTGVIPSVAFNLAVPTCFALLVLNAWSFTTGMIRLLAKEARIRSRWVPLALGLLGPLFVALLGNLDMARRIGSGDYGYPEVTSHPFGWLGDIIRGVWRYLTNAQPLPDNAFWDPSRIVDGTINEFPYFTMLFADMHPHLMALPFTSAALLVALAALLARRWPDETTSAPLESDASVFGFAQPVRRLVAAMPPSLTFDRALLAGLTALVTGALYPLNTWDFPTYVAITAGAFFLLEMAASALAPAPEPGAEVPGSTDEALPGLETGADSRSTPGGASSVEPWVSTQGPDDATPTLSLSTQHSALSTRDGWRFTFAALRRAAIWTGVTVVLGRLLFWPYFAHYAVPNSGFDPWQDVTTRPSQYLLIHGIMLFFIVSFLLAELAATLPPVWSWRVVRPAGFRWEMVDDGDIDRRRVDASLTMETRPLAMRPIVLAVVAFLLILFLSVFGDRLLWLLGGLLLLTAAVAWQRRNEPVRLFLLGMVGIALAISAAVELYTLRGDIGRMNTVFKFYLQIWLLFGLVAAVAAVLLIARYRDYLGRRGKAGWALAALILIVAGLAYPVQATPARLDDRFEPLPRTLDGMAYMPSAVYEDGGPDGGNPGTYSLAGDYAAIRWLQDNVEGSPVILEGVTPLYRWGSRVSVYTGLPAVFGWDWHQTQQRAGYGDLINQRRDDVETMFNSAGSFAGIRPLLDQYHVRYIYVGELERLYYRAAGLRKFERAVAEGALTVAYQADGVTIYRYDGAPR